MERSGMAPSDSSDEDGSMEGRVVDNTENRFALDLVFVKILLPALRVYVLERLEAFYREYPLLGKPGGYRQFESDPVKKNVELIHPVVMYGKDDLLPNFHEFAKLYFEKPYFENLLKCGDIRVFLVLVTKAGCFNGSQASLIIIIVLIIIIILISMSMSILIMILIIINYIIIIIVMVIIVIINTIIIIIIIIIITIIIIIIIMIISIRVIILRPTWPTS